LLWSIATVELYEADPMRLEEFLASFVVVPFPAICYGCLTPFSATNAAVQYANFLLIKRIVSWARLSKPQFSQTNAHFSSTKGDITFKMRKPCVSWLIQVPDLLILRCPLILDARCSSIIQAVPKTVNISRQASD
jgi:hypothetical protein